MKRLLSCITHYTCVYKVVYTAQNQAYHDFIRKIHHTLQFKDFKIGNF